MSFSRVSHVLKIILFIYYNIRFGHLVKGSVPVRGYLHSCRGVSRSGTPITVGRALPVSHLDPFGDEAMIVKS